MGELKQSSIGSYPAHWDVVTLESVAELKHGYQFRTYDFTKEGIKVFKITQIKADGVIDISSCDYIDSSRLENFKKFIIQKGDILMALSGATIGKIARFNSDEIVLQNYRVGNFLPLNEKVLHKNYFYYFLSTEYTYQQILANQTQSAQENVGKEDIHKMLIFLPPYEEQQSIASILSSLDDKIDLLHRQNKTLEQLAETLFRQWFVEDKIWDGKLSEYIKIQGGYAFKSQDFREVGFAGVIKITNISMGSVDIINTQYVDEEVVKKIEEEKFRARRGDFLIAMTGAEIGKIGMIEQTNKQIWVNQRVGKLVEKVPFGNIVGYLALKSREGQEHIINTCSGSAQENISSSGIEEMDFMKYSPQIVEKFGLETKPLFEKILFNMAQIRTLTQLRDTLLPKLLSGEVRVKM